MTGEKINESIILRVANPNFSAIDGGYSGSFDAHFKSSQSSSGLIRLLFLSLELSLSLSLVSLLLVEPFEVSSC